MSEATRRALTIVRDHPNLTAASFAERMWPHSPGWQRSTKAGNRSIPGGGMPSAGGSYLARLERQGFVRWEYTEYKRRTWTLTDAGAAALAD